MTTELDSVRVLHARVGVGRHATVPRLDIMPIMRCWMSSLDGMPRSSVDSMCGNFQRRRLAWLHLRSRRLLVSLRNDWLVAVKHLPQVPEVLRQRMRGG